MKAAAILTLCALAACHKSTPWTLAPTVAHTLTFPGLNEGYDVRVDVWLLAEAIALCSSIRGHRIPVVGRPAEGSGS